jgi:hypothetical protein
MTPILGIMASQISGHLTPPSSFESIATVTVGGGGAADITFSSIAADWTHLQIRTIYRTNRVTSGDNDLAFLQFNSDTGSNYSWHYLQGNGSTAASGAGTSQISIWTWLGAGSTSGANIFGAQITDILEYSNTNIYKTVRNLGGLDLNSATTNAAMNLTSGNWRNTAAITSIKITPGFGTSFSQYTQFALYGIKGA